MKLIPIGFNNTIPDSQLTEEERKAALAIEKILDKAIKQTAKTVKGEKK
jgi:hypothetical protein